MKCSVEKICQIMDSSACRKIDLIFMKVKKNIVGGTEWPNKEVGNGCFLTFLTYFLRDHHKDLWPSLSFLTTVCNAQ